MRSPLRTAAVALVLAVGMTGCAGSGDDVRDRLADITLAANDRDADGLREAADDLIDELRAQQQAGELDQARADRLTQLANQVRADADLIDQDALDVETARREAEEAARKAAEEAGRREASEQARRAAEEAARQAEEKAREAEQKARELLEKDKDKDKGKGQDKDDEKDDEQDDG